MTKHTINTLLFALNVGVLVLFFRSSDHFFLFLFLAFGFFFLVLSAGVLFLRFNYFMKSIVTIDKPAVLLTFDDGPNPETTPMILDTLKKHEVKAIFFVIGKKALAHPEIVQRMLHEGHRIGNHTFSHHPMFALLSGKKVKNEIQQLQTVLDGHAVQTELFRPPIGYSNPIIARVVKDLGVKVIGWNQRSYDTVVKNPMKLAKRLVRLSKPGSIILLHDNLVQSRDSLNSYLSEAKEKGIIFANEQHLIRITNEIN